MLLQQLKSPSLTVVSNACGTLWNLSARCAEDQRALWDMGAVSMLRSLVHSKHKMISMGSSAALKNLLSAKPNNNFLLFQVSMSVSNVLLNRSSIRLCQKLVTISNQVHHLQLQPLGCVMRNLCFQQQSVALVPQRGVRAECIILTSIIRHPQGITQKEQ